MLAVLLGTARAPLPLVVVVLVTAGGVIPGDEEGTVVVVAGVLPGPGSVQSLFLSWVCTAQDGVGTVIVVFFCHHRGCLLLGHHEQRWEVPHRRGDGTIRGTIIVVV